MVTRMEEEVIAIRKVIWNKKGFTLTLPVRLVRMLGWEVSEEYARKYFAVFIVRKERTDGTRVKEVVLKFVPREEALEIAKQHGVTIYAR